MSHNYYNETFTYFAGTYYGYPDCCIDDYNKRSKNKFRKLIDKASCIEKNTGFMPCLKCIKHLEKNDLPVESLITDKRRCPQDFPNGDINNQDDKNLIILITNSYIKSEINNFNERSAKYYIKKGLKKGYPKCCVEYYVTHYGFEENKELNSLNPESISIGKNIGFYPCFECSQKIING